MIVSKLISGLGNQLFQYALGRQLAIKNGSTLKLDVSFFAGQNLRSFKLKQFNIEADILTEADNEKILERFGDKFFYSKLYKKIEGKVPKFYQRYYKEDEWWVYEPGIFKTFGNVYLEGYWQHYKYFEHLDPRIFKELTLADPSELSALPVFDAIADDQYATSVHIRRADYITDKTANSLMGVLPISYYETAMNVLKNKIKTPSYYIFSDDLNWAKDNLKLNGPACFIDIYNGKKDYLELMLMSKCRNNIIANSSFSWWGAFLNRNPGKTIFIPANWVADQTINKNIKLDFPSWFKI